jgi:hypothetical protein
LKEYFSTNKLSAEKNIPSVSGQTVVVVNGLTVGVVTSLDGCDVPVPTKHIKIHVIHFIRM